MNEGEGKGASVKLIEDTSAIIFDTSTADNGTVTYTKNAETAIQPGKIVLNNGGEAAVNVEIKIENATGSAFDTAKFTVSINGQTAVTAGAGVYTDTIVDVAPGSHEYSVAFELVDGDYGINDLAGISGTFAFKVTATVEIPEP